MATSHVNVNTQGGFTMKKKMKQAAAAILSVCMLAAATAPSGSVLAEVSPLQGISAFAATGATDTSENYNYQKNSDGKIIITKYRGNCQSVQIPATIKGIDVVSVDPATFKNTNVDTVFFADGSKVTYFRGFKGMSKLKKVATPANCESVDREAFKGCTGLTTVVFNSSLKQIEKEAFKDCTSLKSVTFPNSLEEIGESAFSGCKQLSTVTLNNKVELGQFAFANCGALTSIQIPKGVKVKWGAFNRCGLQNVTIPADSDPSNFAVGAFNSCESLVRINNKAPYSINQSTSKPSLNSELSNIAKEIFGSCAHVKWVDEYAKACSRYVIKTIRAQNPNISDVQMALKLHDWLCNNVSYDMEKYNANEVSGLQYASSAFLRGKTVCAGYADAYKTLLTEADIPCRTIDVLGKHAWNAVCLEEKWFHVDVTWDDPDNGTAPKRKHFLRTDAERVQDSGYEKDNWRGNNGIVCKSPMGDVSGNGTVNDYDLQRLNNYLLGNGTIQPKNKILADMDFDGEITSFDLVKLRQKLSAQ